LSSAQAAARPRYQPRAALRQMENETEPDLSTVYVSFSAEINAQTTAVSNGLLRESGSERPLGRMVESGSERIRQTSWRRSDSRVFRSIRRGLGTRTALVPIRHQGIGPAPVARLATHRAASPWAPSSSRRSDVRLIALLLFRSVGRHDPSARSCNCRVAPDLDGLNMVRVDRVILRTPETPDTGRVLGPERSADVPVGVFVLAKRTIELR
jgi:hypothetical protein